MPGAGSLPAMPAVLDLWQKTSRLPQGKRIFSIAFARKAPYFATVRPRFVDIRPNRAELVIPKRRKVHNHIGTLHAIALCNGLEAAMGALAEATIPRDKRWIPKETDPEQWTDDALPASGGELPVRVRGTRRDGEVVIEGVIRLWVTVKTTRP
jgi:hypothetical protein